MEGLDYLFLEEAQLVELYEVFIKNENKKARERYEGKLGRAQARGRTCSPLILPYPEDQISDLARVSARKVYRNWCDFAQRAPMWREDDFNTFFSVYSM